MESMPPTATAFFSAETNTTTAVLQKSKRSFVPGWIPALNLRHRTRNIGPARVRIPTRTRHRATQNHDENCRSNSSRHSDPKPSNIAPGAYLRLLGHASSLGASAPPLGLRLSALLAGARSPARLGLSGHLLLATRENMEGGRMGGSWK